jgi:hypothetical protein
MGARPARIDGEPTGEFDGVEPLSAGVGRIALRSCGVRVVISDLLFEAPMGPLFAKLSQGAGLVGVFQVLDAFDEDPQPGEGARLTDAESGQGLDRFLTAAHVERYRERLQAHLGAIEAAARRVRAQVCRVPAALPLEESLRGAVGRMLVPAGG